MYRISLCVPVSVTTATDEQTNGRENRNQIHFCYDRSYRKWPLFAMMYVTFITYAHENNIDKQTFNTTKNKRIWCSVDNLFHIFGLAHKQPANGFSLRFHWLPFNHVFDHSSKLVSYSVQITTRKSNDIFAVGWCENNELIFFIFCCFWLLKFSRHMAVFVELFFIG